MNTKIDTISVCTAAATSGVATSGNSVVAAVITAPTIKDTLTLLNLVIYLQCFLNISYEVCPV